MKNQEIKDSLKEIFVETLGHNSFELEDNTTAHDIDGWDSVTHMMLINEIENKYNIKFSLMDLMKLDNIGSLIKSIKTKIASVVSLAMVNILEVEQLVIMF